MSGALRSGGSRAGRWLLAPVVAAAVSVPALTARADEAYRTTDACPRIEARGRWVVDARERGVRRPGTKGLQTSGLDWDPLSRVLWSVGDQSSVAGRERYGRLYRIDPAAGDAQTVPLTVLPFERETEIEHDLHRFLHRSGRASFDFEAVTRVPVGDAAPSGARDFLVVSEHSGPAALLVRWEGGDTVRLVDWWPLATGLRPHRSDDNRRLEGLALDEVGGLLYATYEQAVEGAGYVLAYPWPLPAPGRQRLTGRPEPLEAVRRRRVHDDAWGDPSGLNGLALERRGEALRLWAVQSFAGRLIRLDGEAVPTGCWKLDLLDPDGERYAYASPEGIALDPAGKRLWIVTDPAVSRYGPEGRGRRVQGRYVNFVPMLYEIPLPADDVPEVVPEEPPNDAPNDASDPVSGGAAATEGGPPAGP